MKITINQSKFIDEFRAIRPDNFSYDGLGALYEYLEELEESFGEEIDLDIIAICCDFDEYKSIIEAAEQYSDLDKVYTEEEALEFLEENTTVIRIPGKDSVIVRNF